MSKIRSELRDVDLLTVSNSEQRGQEGGDRRPNSVGRAGEKSDERDKLYSRASGVPGVQGVLYMVTAITGSRTGHYYRDW